MLSLEVQYIYKFEAFLKFYKKINLTLIKLWVYKKLIILKVNGGAIYGTVSNIYINISN
jgi:hypothetical protein